MLSFIAGALAKAIVVGVVEYYRPGSTSQVVDFAVSLIVKAVSLVRR